VFIDAKTFTNYNATLHAVIRMIRFAGGVSRGNANTDRATDFAIALLSMGLRLYTPGPGTVCRASAGGKRARRALHQITG
jgi:hypothetical protein